MKTSKKIIFFGNERLATGVTTQLPVLTSLLLNGYDIKAIILTPAISNPSRNTKTLEIINFATSRGIQILNYRKNDAAFIKHVESLKTEIAILVAFGQIVPTSIIDLFPKGIINLHPSLLPLHRGPTPIESTIIKGERKTGISLIKLVAEMDAGPIYRQVATSISATIDKQALADQLGNIGATELVKVLPLIINDRLVPTSQTGLASYDKKLSTASSQLDFKKPAIEIERQIRAYAGWPKSKLTINNVPITITKAHTAKIHTTTVGGLILVNNYLAIETSDGVLVIDKLIPAGAKEMSSPDFMRGRKINLLRSLTT